MAKYRVGSLVEVWNFTSLERHLRVVASVEPFHIFDNMTSMGQWGPSTMTMVSSDAHSVIAAFAGPVEQRIYRGKKLKHDQVPPR